LTEPPRFRIETLQNHQRESFECGVAALDAYLRTQASQDVKKHAAVTFVLTPDGSTIAGYYTLSQYSVELAAFPNEIIKKLPKYPFVPATLLGRLAVSLSFRGERVGHLLLMDALHRCLTGSRQLAAAAVVVDAKNGGVESFYRKYGFINLPRMPQRLILPMTTIEKLFV
jgi:predicted GNAT family N-acyltransferase